MRSGLVSRRHRRQLLRGDISTSGQGADDRARYACCDAGRHQPRRANRGIRVGGSRPEDFNRLVHGHAEANLLFGAPEAGMPEADRPGIDDFAEVLHRAVGVGRGPFAAKLVEAVAESMTVVAKLLGEAAGVEMGATRTVVVDGAVSYT